MRLAQIWRTVCRSETLCVAALLVTSIAPLLGPALLGDRILLPADLVFSDALWHSQAPPGFRGPANSLRSDQIFLYCPWRFLSQQAVRQYHELPLWNPFVFSGQSFVANGQSAQLYPLHQEWLFPDTPALAYLQSPPQPTRVMGMDSAMLFNYGMVVGVPQIGGYDMPVSQQFADLYTQLGGSDIHRQRWQPQWPLLDICGIQYVIGSAELPPNRYELVYDGEVHIQRLRQAQPRAFTVQRVGVADGKEALPRLLTSQFDHRRWPWRRQSQGPSRSPTWPQPMICVSPATKRTGSRYMSTSLVLRLSFWRMRTMTIGRPPSMARVPASIQPTTSCGCGRPSR